jgi:hypothetical protein
VLLPCCDYRAQNFGRRSFFETRNYKSDYLKFLKPGFWVID